MNLIEPFFTDLFSALKIVSKSNTKGMPFLTSKVIPEAAACVIPEGHTNFIPEGRSRES